MFSAAFGRHRWKSTSTIIVAAAIFCFSRASFARRIASRRLLAASRCSLRAFFDALNALAKVNCQINSSRERKQGGQNGVPENLVGRDGGAWGGSPSQLDWVATGGIPIKRLKAALRQKGSSYS